MAQDDQDRQDIPVETKEEKPLAEQKPPSSPDEMGPASEDDEGEGPSRAPKVFGILHLVIGGLSVLLFLGLFIFGLVMRNSMQNVSMDERTRVMMEVSRELENVPVIRISGFTMMAFSLLFTGLLIGAGVLLVKARKSGRLLSLCYAVGNIVFGIVNIAFHEIVVKSHYTRIIESTLDPATQNMLLKWMSIQTFAVNCCCCFVYPVLILIFMLPERFGRDLR